MAIWRLVQAGRLEEARAIYRWFRPLLDLDVSTNLVQNIKLAEVFAIQSNDRVRAPACRCPELNGTAWPKSSRTR